MGLFCIAFNDYETTKRVTISEDDYKNNFAKLCWKNAHWSRHFP